MNRFNGSSPVIPHIEFSDTELHTWFERDRQHVELRSKLNEETICEWWDDDVSQALEDGFLNQRDLHWSAYQYAQDMGLLRSVA